MSPPRQLFVTGTGTGVGKTFLTRGLARACVKKGLATVALKPIETGCDPVPLDAQALARACSGAELSNAPGLYRAKLAVAPYAATLAGELDPPGLDDLVRTCVKLAESSEVMLIEGAGGLLVPIDRHRSAADLARAFGAPLLLVARNELGVLSHTLTAYEAAASRALQVAAVVLVNADTASADPSRQQNMRILAERLPCPVHEMPPTADDDDALATAIESAGLLGTLRL